MEQPQTAIAALDFFTASKVGIDVASDQLIEAVRSGEVNPLKLRVWVKTVETILERVNKETAYLQMTEAGKYPQGKIDFAGATIERAELGTKYDYMVCKDTVWERLDAEMKSLKDRIAVREQFLKSLKEPLTVVDDMTGEVVTLQPPNKTSTSGLKITIR